MKTKKVREKKESVVDEINADLLLVITNFKALEKRVEKLEKEVKRKNHKHEWHIAVDPYRGEVIHRCVLCRKTKEIEEES